MITMKKILTKEYIKKLVKDDKWDQLYIIEHNLYTNRTLTNMTNPELMKSECKKLTKDIYVDIYCQRNNIDTPNKKDK